MKYLDHLLFLEPRSCKMINARNIIICSGLDTQPFTAIFKLSKTSNMLCLKDNGSQIISLLVNGTDPFSSLKRTIVTTFLISNMIWIRVMAMVLRYIPDMYFIRSSPYRSTLSTVSRFKSRSPKIAKVPSCYGKNCLITVPVTLQSSIGKLNALH